jgi:hypothetical protein
LIDAGAAVEHIVTETASHNVVTGATGHFDVCIETGIDVVGVRAAVQQIRFAATEEEVHAVATGEYVFAIPESAVDGTTGEHLWYLWCSKAYLMLVLDISETWQIDEIGRIAVKERSRGGQAIYQRVSPARGLDKRLSDGASDGTTPDDVNTRIAGNCVIALATDEEVISFAAANDVTPEQSEHVIVAALTEDTVGTDVTEDLVRPSSTVNQMN